MSLGFGTAWGLLCCWSGLAWFSVAGEITVRRCELKVDMSTWRRRVLGAEGLMLCSTGRGRELGVSLGNQLIGLVVCAFRVRGNTFVLGCHGGWMDELCV